MSTQERIRRRERLGTKLFRGYVPFTAGAVAAIALLVSTSRSWAAVLAGGVVVVIWSTQVAITNLFVVVLRLDRWFYGKALLVSVASMLLLPFLAVASHQYRLFSMGEPDVPSHVREVTGSRCFVLEADGARIRDGVYSFKAKIQCAGSEAPRECTLLFWYDKTKKQWRELTSLSLTCARS